MVKLDPTNPHHVKIAELAGWEEPRYDNLWNNFGLDISIKLWLYTIFLWLLFPIWFYLLLLWFRDDQSSLLLLSSALILTLFVLVSRKYLSIFEKFYHKGLKIRAKETARHNEEKEGEIEEEKKSQIKWVEETIAKGGLENYQDAIDIFGIDPDYAEHDNYFGEGMNTKKLILGVKAKIAMEYEKLLDYNKAIKAYKDAELPDEIIRVTKLMGDDKVKHLDYDEAIEIYESIGDKKAAKNARKLKAEQGAVRVTQKVVHGDEVTKTEIKDSVVSKSNIGSGGDDKLTKIKELKELHDAGAIDDDEFKQMKKEILGK